MWEWFNFRSSHVKRGNGGRGKLFSCFCICCTCWLLKLLQIEAAAPSSSSSSSSFPFACCSLLEMMNGMVAGQVIRQRRHGMVCNEWCVRDEWGMRNERCMRDEGSVVHHSWGDNVRGRVGQQWGVVAQAQWQATFGLHRRLRLLLLLLLFHFNGCGQGAGGAGNKQN